ncbi:MULTISPECIES: hypothetical protein [Peribacillus]|uniref:hypothetical protein n=1 Tax=Peribacillus TaxID=2675229 RepID=UPI001F4D6DF0|nr:MULTISPECIES: hypothetical protein [unclassified Peribacillus]MCK1985950.1 hypothetical protein [Peribacillus sp. Aquil_B1]MCK2010785.1 hypothetical protein [Peribacillus sp. Aquil_B8]
MTVPFLNFIIWRRNGGQMIIEEKEQARACPFRNCGNVSVGLRNPLPFRQAPAKQSGGGLASHILGRCRRYST